MAKHKFAINDKEYDVEVGARQGRHVQVSVNGKPYDVELKSTAVAAPLAPRAKSIAAPALGAAAQPAAGGGDGSVVAPMAGLVLSISVRVGDQVNAGDDLLMLEAMKMENAITAHRSGTVLRIAVDTQQVVNQGDILIELV